MPGLTFQGVPLTQHGHHLQNITFLVSRLLSGIIVSSYVLRRFVKVKVCLHVSKTDCKPIMPFLQHKNTAGWQPGSVSW